MRVTARVDAPDPGRRAPGPVQAFVGLGANMGEPQAMLRWALAALDALPATRLQACSALYRSAPIDCPPDSPAYFNAVAQLETALCAPDLLQALLALEAQAGRERPHRNAPRTLDLDLLRYGDARIESATLTVPHPRMMARAFVLVPLAELAPDGVSPSALQAVAGQGLQRLGPLF